MEPSRTPSKDETINLLKAQLEVYKTKTSLLQQRLTSVLDLVDDLQNQHLLELDTEARKRKHAEAKLRLYIDTVQAAEVERDDLRDAVTKLVAKVESGNNDFKCWPRSHMQISNFLDPAQHSPSFQLNQTGSKTGSGAGLEDQLLSYAGAIIDTLTHERDMVRIAHAHTRELFEARINTLEAQVARRDAELEACGENIQHPVLGGSTVPREGIQKVMKEQVPNAQEEVLNMVQRTTARNKTLEEEIKGLFKRLEQARISNPASESVPSLPAQPSSERPPTVLRPGENPVQVLGAQRNPPLARSGNFTADTPQVCSSPPNMLDQATTPSSTPATYSVAVPHPLRGTISQPIDAQSLYGHPNVAGASHPSRDDHNGRHHLTQATSHLDHQIAELSAKIDAFKVERDVLWQAIASQRDAAGLPSASPYQQYSPDRELETEPEGASAQPPIDLKNECISLRRAVRQLREELLEARTNAQDRERELLEQLEQMGTGQGLADAIPHIADLTIVRDHVPMADNLLEPYDGEMSMDLATPLFPVSLLPPSSPYHSRPHSRSSRSQTQSPDINVHVSGEEERSQSPRMIRPRILTSPSPPSQLSSSGTPPLSPSPQPLPSAPRVAFIQTSPSSPELQTFPPPLPPDDSRTTISASRASMERVERELAAEQRRLHEGEQQVAELQNVLQDLYG